MFRFDIEDAFQKIGRVSDVWVARKPPGFAFIEMEDKRDAEDACRELDGTRICGNRVKVEMSRGGRNGGGGRGGGGGRSGGRGGGSRRSPSYRSMSRGRRSPSPKRRGRSGSSGRSGGSKGSRKRSTSKDRNGKVTSRSKSRSPAPKKRRGSADEETKDKSSKSRSRSRSRS